MEKELEIFARIYSVEGGKTIAFLDLMRRGIQEEYQLESRIMSEEKYHSASHCKYLIQYHMVS